MEKLTTEKLWLNFTNFTTFDKLPFTVASGNGTYVYDTSKKKYLDIISGIWNAGLGYSRQDIIDEMNYQMNKLPLTSLFGRAYPLLIEYSEKLLKLAPEFSKVFYGTGGSDSVETALKVARLFYYEQQKYKKVKIGHFAMSYHGVSLGAMNVMGEEPNREGCVLDIENYFTLPLPDNNDGDNVFRELDKLNSEEISAIIIEPIIGSGGIIEFPKEFLTLLREYTKNNDILLIFDEVVTGFGRTGSMFAYQGLEIVPDILVLAKNITAGYAPLGATLFSDTIVSIFKNKKLLHGYTNAGSVVGVAAANKVLDIFESENILENVNKQSALFLEKLNELQKKYSSLIHSIKGRGLMLGIQLVEQDGQELEFFYKLLEKKNMLSRSAYNNTIVLMPPLVSEENFILEIINRLDECFYEYSKKYN